MVYPQLRPGPPCCSRRSQLTPEDYWAALVRFHLAQQFQRPEADLWDLLVATDRVARFLSDEIRDEVGILVESA